MILVDALLRPADPQPMITWYDGPERIELSGVTTANWAAKAANLLRDDADVEPGARIALLLPAHWQTAAVLLAAWWCGAEIVTGDADVVLCDGPRVADAVAPTVIALSLDAFGKGLSGLPAGVVDFATEVRAHGDVFAPWAPVPDEAPALDGLPAADVVTQARDRATALGIGPGDRVLSTLAWSGDGLVDGLLAVLAAGASLVQVAHADQATLDRVATAERTTVRLA